MNAETARRILSAEVSDLQFVDQPVSAHSMSTDLKTGFIPSTIKELPFPDELRITFVKSVNPNGVSYYVVNQLGKNPGVAGPILTATDEEAAKRILLVAVKSYLKSCGFAERPEPTRSGAVA